MANDLNAQKGTYVASEWKDDVSDFTPITPEKLNHIEQGIQANSEDCKALGDAWDSASQTVINSGSTQTYKVYIGTYTYNLTCAAGTATDLVAYESSAIRSMFGRTLTTDDVIVAMNGNRDTAQNLVVSAFMQGSRCGFSILSKNALADAPITICWIAFIKE